MCSYSVQTSAKNSTDEAVRVERPLESGSGEWILIKVIQKLSTM